MLLGQPLDIDKRIIGKLQFSHHTGVL
jgi:hypothetical protein